jgi:hypothetical protein
MAERHGVHVLGAGPGSLVLAAPRPTPRLAAEMAALFPTLAIVWQVLGPAVARVSKSHSDRAYASLSVEFHA